MPTANNSGNVMRWLEPPAQYVQICAVTTANIWDDNETEPGKIGNTS